MEQKYTLRELQTAIEHAEYVLETSDIEESLADIVTKAQHHQMLEVLCEEYVKIETENQKSDS